MKIYCKVILLTAAILYLVSFVVAAAESVNGENQSAEVIEGRLQSAALDKKVELLSELVWLYRNNQTDKAIRYGEQALDILGQIPNSLLETKVLHAMAWAHMREGDYELAKLRGQKSYELASKINHKKSQAYAANVLGAVDWFQGNFLHALDFFLHTLEIRIEIGDKLDIARSYNNIGSVYQEINEYQKAREFHQLSLNMMQEIGHDYGVATSYFNLGIINHRIGDNAQEQVNLEKALTAFTQLKDHAALAEVRIHLAHLKLKQQAYAEAEKLFEVGLAESIKLDNRSLIGRAQLGIANVRFATDRAQQGLTLAQESLTTALQLKEKTQVRDAYELLSNIYQKLGRHEQALQAFMNFHHEKDAILETVYQGKLSLLQEKFDTEQAKERIEGLEREKAFSELRRLQAEQKSQFLFYGLVSGGLFILIIVFQYWKLHRQNKQTYLLSVTDNLCGCFNRNYLFSHLIPLLVKEPQTAFALLIDLDRFKTVNDDYGHDVGDKLLAAFSHRVKTCISENEYLIRLGGEEFVVLGVGDDERQVMRLASAIKNVTSTRAFDISPKISLNMTCSIGVSIGELSNESSVVELIKVADIAMYKAKREGRNRVVPGFRSVS